MCHLTGVSERPTGVARPIRRSWSVAEPVSIQPGATAFTVTLSDRLELAKLADRELETVPVVHLNESVESARETRFRAESDR